MILFRRKISQQIMAERFAGAAPIATRMDSLGLSFQLY